MQKQLQLSTVLILISLGLAAQNQYVDLSSTVGINTTGPNISINVVDANNDGLEDVFVGRNNEANQLFINNGDDTFSEQAAAAGIADDSQTYASIWGDLDNDGDQDLYLGNRAQANRLYRNDGDGNFTDITLAAGVGDEGAARTLLLSDINQDDWLDIYVANLGGENVMYRNNGDGTFLDVTVSCGALDDQLSLGAIFFDYDQDGDSDLYLTHDNNQANILYQNNGNGFFTDVSASSNADFAGFGMGVATGDINRDGWLDIYITNLYDNVLLLNQGDGTFEDITSTAGINDYGMGWGTTFLDFDNDGWLDIYAVNDSYFSPYDNVLYRNQGNNSFAIVSQEQVESSPYGAYGTATLDLNRDGKLDLLVSNFGLQGGNQYFQNVTNTAGKWLQVKLEGVESNRDAIGAQLTLYADDTVWRQEVYGGSGYASQNSLWQHFGLGDSNEIDSLHIRWPNGLEETYYGIATSQFLRFTEGDGITNTQNIMQQNYAEIYPNPVSGSELYLKTKVPAGVEAVVFLQNAQGQILRTVFEGKLEQEGQELAIPVADLPPGAYRVNLQMHSTFLSFQVIRQ